MMARHRNEPIEPQLISVPAGRYQVGTSDEQVRLLAQHSSEAQAWRQKGYFGREQPAHSLHLPAFQIAKYPVSVAEYRSFMADSGYSRPDYWTDAGRQWLQKTGRAQPALWDDAGSTTDPHLPVVGVSWYEATAYCRWLADRTGRPYRLPSEAEWAAAARGPGGLLYPWGNVFDSRRCNWRESGLGRPLEPGTFSPAGDSPFGLADMAGNVSEWTQSLFRPYPIQPGDGRDDPNATGVRVIRGGSWFSPAVRLRAAARGYNDPDFFDHDVSFRLAASG